MANAWSIPKKLLATLRPENIKEFEADKITFPSGAVIEGVKIKSDDDLRRFNEFATTQTTPNRKVSLATPMSQRLSQCIAEREKAGLDEAIQNEYSHSIGFLIECCRDLDPNDFTVEHADHVTELLQCLPPNHKKRQEFADMSMKQAAVWNRIQNGRTIAIRTIEKHLDRIRTFFGWCKDRYYLAGPNLFVGRKLMNKSAREERVREACRPS